MIRRVRGLTFAALLCACSANSPAESPGDGGDPQTGSAPADAGVAEAGGAKPSAEAGSAPGMGAAADGGGAGSSGGGTTGGSGTADAGAQPDLSEELFAATSFPRFDLDLPKTSTDALNRIMNADDPNQDSY